MWTALAIAAVGIGAIYLYGMARNRQGRAEVAAEAGKEVRRTAELARRVEDEIANADRDTVDSLGLRKRPDK